MISETLRIASTHPALPGHFPGNPLVPGVVLLTRVIDAAERLHEGKARVSAMPSVKFLAPVSPEQTIVLSLTSVSASLLKFECRTGATLIATGSIELLISER